MSHMTWPVKITLGVGDAPASLGILSDGKSRLEAESKVRTG